MWVNACPTRYTIAASVTRNANLWLRVALVPRNDNETLRFIGATKKEIIMKTTRTTSLTALAAMALLGIAVLPKMAQAQSLTTLFAHTVNNNQFGGGTYFDLNVASGIKITSLTTNVVNVPLNTLINLGIYTRTGTVFGFENTNVGWTLVATGSGNSAAVNSPTFIDVTDFLLGPGVTGVAIQNVNYAAAYTAGNGSNEFYSNADLSLTGISANSFFLIPGTIVRPRVWNGTINYVVTAPEPGTLAFLALGGTLVLVRRRGQRKEA